MTIPRSECCCSPFEAEPCAKAFRGGYSAGADLLSVADWSDVKFKQFDPYYPLAQCFGLPQDQCSCSPYESQCNAFPSPHIEHSYCDGGTLPCSLGNITLGNSCDGCYGGDCVGYYGEPVNKTAGMISHKFHLCADIGLSVSENYSRGGIWIPSNELYRPQCAPYFDSGRHYAQVGEQIDADTIWANNSREWSGGENASCCPNPCLFQNSRTSTSIWDNNSTWKIGWCRAQGTKALLYPQRRPCTEPDFLCHYDSDNICASDKSYCAMASETLQNLGGGWQPTNSITKLTYRMGNKADSYDIIVAGSGYNAGETILLTWISGNQPPDPLGCPWVTIDSVNQAGGITSVSVPENGGGNKCFVGQVYAVADGDGLARLEIDSVDPWNAFSHPWFRIHLRTIPDSHTVLQDPATKNYVTGNYASPAYEFLLNRCWSEQLSGENAHYCIYKDCVALPYTTACPPEILSLGAVTQPYFQFTNYNSNVVNDYGADLNPLGMTVIDQWGNHVKTPWVTLALLQYWTWSEQKYAMVKVEIKSHCFGTQLTWKNRWDADGNNVHASVEVQSNDFPKWLGLRANSKMEKRPFNPETEFDGIWWGYNDTGHNQPACNALIGDQFDACCGECGGCTGKGTWRPDNSDEWRIDTMDQDNCGLEARYRYNYAFVASVGSNTAQYGKQLTDGLGCCAGCNGGGATGCDNRYVVTGYGSCSCSGGFCLPHSVGSKSCNDCCNTCNPPDYAFCLEENPIHDEDVIEECQGTVLTYSVFSPFRVGWAHGNCDPNDPYGFVLPVKPAPSAYGKPLLFGSVQSFADMFISYSITNFANTSQSGAGANDGVCGIPCTRKYGGATNYQTNGCMQPCQSQLCGHPRLYMA